MSEDGVYCTALIVHPNNNYDIVEPTGTGAGGGTGNNTSSTGKGNQRFVGLSNQGATCYMNSLLQTLFMTPEFRTALYKWRYNPEKDGAEAHSIPLQLQKLFGLLQISTTRSVDTVALTKSFGWEGSEVFQQQDVQELCRVLFDALEESFKGSELEKTIDEIYAGEMVDYVKCIDIEYQSERRDKFLDCSLAIRPYGSTKSMKSLVECLDHYLEPEILDGDNKYFAESVGRKVDAVKGLKFSKLPQILSVQLKRFVYDFSGDSVIQMKINDEVSFPLILDMNKYVSHSQQSSGNDNENIESENKTSQVIDEFEEFLQKRIHELRQKKSSQNPEANSLGDVSTEKGGDWNSGKGSPASMLGSGYDNLESKDDFDLNVPDLVDCNGNLHPDLVKLKESQPLVTPAETPEIHQQAQPEQIDVKELLRQRGEWIYELFAVLVHSGAISGGHYYVYIKDIETNKWWNFNDSYVDEISVEKVLQASGGMISHTNYYGVKSQIMSSANAYMLMYRKVSLSNERKTSFPPDSMVPDYIRQEVQKLVELAEKRKREEEERFNRLPLQIYWNNKAHPTISYRNASYKSLLQQIWTELDLFNSEEYQDILKRDRFLEESQALEKNNGTEDPPPLVIDPTLVPLDQVRLRVYSVYSKMKQEPFSVERGSFTLEALRISVYRDLIVEMKSKYETWEPYDPEGFNLQLLVYDPELDDFQTPITLRLPRISTLKDLKNRIQQLPNFQSVDVNALRILKLAIWSYSEIKIDEITSNDTYSDKLRLILDLRVCEGQKLYIESSVAPLKESPSVRCFTLQTNRINVLVNHPGKPGEPDKTLIVDRRWNMKEFRHFIAKEFSIDSQSFRIFRKTSMDSELNGELSQTLYSLGIYNGISLSLMPGKPLLPGHYLLKLYHYKSPHKGGLHDLNSIIVPTEKSIGDTDAVPTTASTDLPPLIEVVAEYLDDVPLADTPKIVIAADATSVPQPDAYPVSQTPMSDSDLEVLTSGIKIEKKRTDVSDPFKADIDAPESRPDDIIGFGFKMIELMPTNEQFEFLMDFDVEGDTKSLDIKKQIHEHFLSVGKITADITPEHLRLRLKTRTTLSSILSHNLTLRENQVNLFNGREMAVEILDHEERHSMLPYGDAIVYIQRWNRSTWTLSSPIEVILHGDMTVQEISKRLASLTGIDYEGFRVLLLQPYNEVKLCDLHLSQPNGHRPWTNTTIEMRKLSQMQWYLRDWDTLLVQDINEPLKKLSLSEIRSVTEAKAYQSNYAYDYYDTYIPSTGSATVSTTSSTDVKRPQRVEKGIHIKTQKDREKDKLESEKRNSVDIDGGTVSEPSDVIILGPSPAPGLFYDVD